MDSLRPRRRPRMFQSVASQERKAFVSVPLASQACVHSVANLHKLNKSTGLFSDLIVYHLARLIVFSRYLNPQLRRHSEKLPATPIPTMPVIISLERCMISFRSAKLAFCRKPAFKDCLQRVSSLEEYLSHEALESENRERLYGFYHWLTREQHVSPSWARFVLWYHLNALRSLNHLLLLGYNMPVPFKHSKELDTSQYLHFPRFFDRFVMLHHTSYMSTGVFVQQFLSSCRVDDTHGTDDFHLLIRRIQDEIGVCLAQMPQWDCNCISGYVYVPEFPVRQMVDFGCLELGMITMFYTKLRYLVKLTSEEAQRKIIRWLKSRIEKIPSARKDSGQVQWQFALMGLNEGTDFDVLVDTWFHEFFDFGGASDGRIERSTVIPRTRQSTQGILYAKYAKGPEPFEDTELMRTFAAHAEAAKRDPSPGAQPDAGSPVAADPVTRTRILRWQENGRTVEETVPAGYDLTVEWKGLESGEVTQRVEIRDTGGNLYRSFD
ncbi:hypothetical protein C8R47DRAFT_1158227 [Mycena vitilis]|nr:hypothetical protein C8R47DRAFT_1158227 [Mycena vitilis]